MRPPIASPPRIRAHTVKHGGGEASLKSHMDAVHTNANKENIPPNSIASQTPATDALMLDAPTVENLAAPLKPWVSINSTTSAPNDKVSFDSDSDISDVPSEYENNGVEDSNLSSLSNGPSNACSNGQSLEKQTDQASIQVKQACKRTLPLPGPGSQKKPRVALDRNAEATLEVQKLAYQSIIAINMPPRPSFVPGQPIPAPDPNNLPFGDTENYRNSMIIHYLDELEMSYTAAAKKYDIMFPNEVVTDEAVRRRHIRSLLRLKKKYGMKPRHLIGPVSKVICRRGQKRSKRLVDIEPAPLPQPTSNTQQNLVTKSVTKQSEANKRKRKHTPHFFEKACIVTWHDAGKLDFKEVRDKLEELFDWSLGTGTIERYYYETLERVYGLEGKKDVVEGAKVKVVFKERMVKRRMSF